MEERLKTAVHKAIIFLEATGYRYAIIGGIALAQWGVARYTHDVDIKVVVPDTDYTADGAMNLDKSLVDAVVKYRDIILLMLKFFTDMRANHRKDTKFKNAKLKRLLDESGFLSEFPKNTSESLPKFGTMP